MKLRGFLLVLCLSSAYTLVPALSSDLAQLEHDLYSFLRRDYDFGNYMLSVVQGNITEEHVDVIVNAANAQLKGGGGVCGAIFAAAKDPGLQAACYALYPPNVDGVRCPTGQACVTNSFGLEAQGIEYIIHAVGPNCSKKEDINLLTGAYGNSLKVAHKLPHRKIKGKDLAGNIESIAFPFISSAIYGCENIQAAKLAVAAIKEFFEKNPSTSLKRVQIMAFSPADFALFNKTIKDVYAL